MQIVDIDLPSSWLAGARREWLTSVITDPSDGGIVLPVERQTRPLLRFTFNVNPEDAQDFEDLFILVNGPARGFFCKPPLVRDHFVDGQFLGIASGGADVWQLQIRRGQTWDAVFPDEDTIVVYANGVPLVSSPSLWTLGDDGEITITAPSSNAIHVDFEYKTAFRFIENSLVTTIDNGGVIETVQQVTIEEIPQ